jgi:hypothetical protein
MRFVEVLDIALAKVTHESHARFGRWRREQKVDMVAHQAVRMDLAVEICGQLLEVQEVEQVVAVCSKAGSAIVAALDDMNSDSGKDKASLPGHSSQTAERFRWLTEIGL